ncbi:putative ribosomal protein L2 domain 2 [Rosa chinensis]|uniref:Putative ribosomal protein L2 domain 2 n=1 Tax=Rosa chinensis TaxID=74649 RepID=A0A2P6PDR9_ROSCH|nr:putative ribosomal protein L2 domain 2 [Rosa chinensis]
MHAVKVTTHLRRTFIACRKSDVYLVFYGAHLMHAVNIITHLRHTYIARRKSGPFKRYGEDYGKLVVIVDVIDQNRACVATALPLMFTQKGLIIGRFPRRRPILEKLSNLFLIHLIWHGCMSGATDVKLVHQIFFFISFKTLFTACKVCLKWELNRSFTAHIILLK